MEISSKRPSNAKLSRRPRWLIGEDHAAHDPISPGAKAAFVIFLLVLSAYLILGSDW